MRSVSSMEEYEGILICATNLMNNLDPATMRRLDFKIHFEYLEAAQAHQVALDLLNTLGVEPSEAEQGNHHRRHRCFFLDIATVSSREAGVLLSLLAGELGSIDSLRE